MSIFLLHCTFVMCIHGERMGRRKTYLTRAASWGSRTKSLPAVSAAATSASRVATWGLWWVSSTLRFSMEAELLSSMFGVCWESLSVKASRGGSEFVRGREEEVEGSGRGSGGEECWEMLISVDKACPRQYPAGPGVCRCQD